MKLSPPHHHGSASRTKIYEVCPRCRRLQTRSWLTRKQIKFSKSPTRQLGWKSIKVTSQNRKSETRGNKFENCAETRSFPLLKSFHNTVFFFLRKNVRVRRYQRSVKNYFIMILTSSDQIYINEAFTASSSWLGFANEDL